MRTAILLLGGAVLFTGCGGGAIRGGDRQKGAAVATRAKSQKGAPYRYGGRSPASGFDCSGLAWWSFRQEGILIPQTAVTQFRGGKRISRDSLLPGDLVFFRTVKRSASHVGIYDGTGRFIHAPTSGKGVRASAMDNPYWKRRYLGGRRYW